MRTHLAFLSILVVVLLGCRPSAPEKGSDTISLLARLDQQGRYDDAIRVAQDWMKKHPEETSHNWAFYNQIAHAYLMKASKDTVHKEEWIEQAVAYYDKDLLVHQKTDGDIELYHAGRGFETALDFSPTTPCLHYRKPITPFLTQISSLH